MLFTYVWDREEVDMVTLQQSMLAISYIKAHSKNTIVIYGKYCGVFGPYYSKVLKSICCDNSIVAVVI